MDRSARPVRRSWRDVVAAGAATGLLAGVFMALVAMVKSAILELGVWLPMKQIAAVFWGVEALIGGAGAAAVGALIHLAVSAAWGILFAAMVGPRTRGGTALAFGLAYGALVWMVMAFFVLPLVNPVMSARTELITFPFFLYHLIFGAVLALIPLAQANLLDARAQLRPAV
jgi:hypothetical protein